MKRGLGVLLVGLFVISMVLGQAEQAQAPAPAAAPAASESLPTVDQVLDKYVEALGGKAAIEKGTSRVGKGTFEIPEFGATGTITLFAKAPNKTAVVVDIPGFGMVKQGFDGTVAWDDSPQSGLTERSGAALATAKRDATFYRELQLKNIYKQWEVKGKQKLGEQDVYMLTATPEEGATETWYFDAGTGLVARVDMEREGPQGTGVVQASMKDYRDVEGVKTPFRIEQVLPGMTIIIKFDEVKQNVEINDSQFTKPAVTPPAATPQG
ncbi:MAG: hypothetical protein EHM23_11300 [Acidobacteria bacterium]|nr:MAG: hypothetical protein EHM23_11300 [Acidobacteriota bacterium]